MWRYNSITYLIILGDLHLKQPLSLVVECGLLLALLQLLCDSTHFISCLCSLANVSSPWEPSHNQLQSIEPVFQLLLVIRQLLLELLVVLLHLYICRLDLISDLSRPAQCVPSVRTDMRVYKEDFNWVQILAVLCMSDSNSASWAASVAQ